MFNFPCSLKFLQNIVQFLLPNEVLSRKVFKVFALLDCIIWHLVAHTIRKANYWSWNCIIQLGVTFTISVFEDLLNYLEIPIFTICNSVG